jgi:NADPH2:quinone reductase
MRVISKGQVTIPLKATYPLEQVVQVHKMLEGRETTGATVLMP